MECHVPHSKLQSVDMRKCKNNDNINTQEYNENRVYIDSPIRCPLLNLSADGKTIERNVAVVSEKLINFDLSQCETKLEPLFLPSTVKCGRGPIPVNNKELNKSASEILASRLKLECKKILKRKPSYDMDKIRARLQSSKVRKSVRNLQRIYLKYGEDKSPSYSYAGGNLGKLSLDSDPLLVHFTADEDCHLCLTKIDSQDILDYPSKICHKIPVEGGRVCQVSVPKSHQCPDVLFATRQLHSTSFWNLCKKDSGQLSVEQIDQILDCDSVVNYVDVNPFIKGEFCELRDNHITVSRRSVLIYLKELTDIYKSCLYVDHPQSIMLAGNQHVDLLDMRVGGTNPISPLFSLKNEQIKTYFNISDDEEISAFTPGRKNHIYFMATKSSLIVWDHRMNSRPLLKNTHLMNQAPELMASTNYDENIEWLFLSSQTSHSSAVAALSWNNQTLTNLPSASPLMIPSFEVAPQIRASMLDSLDQLHSNGQGLDWSFQNRYKQHVSGLACHIDQDYVHTWLCTNAGDIFSQRIQMAGSDYNRANCDNNWVPQWTSAVRDIENETFPVIATELYSSSSVLESVNKKIQTWDPDEAQEWCQKPRYLDMPENFDRCIDLSRPLDPRGKKYHEIWSSSSNNIDASIVGFAEADFTQDFAKSLFTSTPHQRGRFQPTESLDIHDDYNDYDLTL